MYISAIDDKSTLKQEIKRGRSQYKETLRTALPPLIINPCDVWSFEWPEVIPNFITQKRITGKVVEANLHDSISGNIVFIPNADPGFDWLFSHEIAGLVTAWGGANSHMAIRAGEMGLPSVIGAGQELYKIWAESECIMIDCAANKVEILS